MHILFGKRFKGFYVHRRGASPKEYGFSYLEMHLPVKFGVQ